ncbi:hypothetical protein [Shewanella surugensis]|uniref:Uncharacterized protein n=1 Tax=Shewanella surugensis TaxID=212020 RepID=A0ABT0L8V1_9GAMM|nr:hypothetical protein [Shewanella surugensis]MCL1123777.1 hypothetical protein [Shewanella surugensis]
MKNSLNKYLFVIALCVAFPATSEESEALTVDQVALNRADLAFPNVDNIKPDMSDFGIQSYVLMSNDLGERWAVLTIKNEASGRRTLNQEHLLAILANGDHIFPKAFYQTFNGNETISVTIAFGKSKFPVLAIYSRT